MQTLTEELDHWLPRATIRLRELRPRPWLEQVGRVERVGDGIAEVSGLPEARLDELVAFPGGLEGMVVDLRPDRVGCVLLGDPEGVGAGDRVRGTGQVARVPVGETLLGRVVDPLGVPLDDRPPILAERRDPVEKAAPAIVDRALVSDPLYTGLMVVDAMFPLGRGQRELIIGDRSTGKTAIAVDTILRQRTTDVVCVYVAIGQKSSAVQRVLADVRAHGAPERCLFVVADAASAAGLQWLAPYAAFTMAEYFMQVGRDVLVVLDDLTKHAAVHRQLALLLRQPPGREAYPGDVFHVHARLLERAARLSEARGGGSLTALPIAETQAGDLTAYIPTNLISITDGQWVLDARLFQQGIKPAVDVGRSVSRVGGKTQTAAMRRLAERLRLEYAQFLELEVFTRFGATLDPRTARAIEHGRRIRAILVQPQGAPWRLSLELAQLVAVESGLLDGLELTRAVAFKAGLASFLEARAEPLLARIDEDGELDEAKRSELIAVMKTWVGQGAPHG